MLTNWAGSKHWYFKYFHKCNCAHVLCPLQPFMRQQGDLGLPDWEDCDQTGQWGSSTLWATDLFKKRMLMSVHIHCIVIVEWVHDTVWLLRLVVWPRASRCMKNRRWHTHIHHQPADWDPNPPKQILTVRPQCHFVVAYVHISARSLLNFCS